jgi:voltage-gated potassium channel
LAGVIVVLGQLVGRNEVWSRFDSLYWSFITATTVGYGDIRPLKKASKVIAVAIALIGLTMTGILIAVAVNAATWALNAHEAAARTLD